MSLSGRSPFDSGVRRLSDSFVGRARVTDSTVAHARREEVKGPPDRGALVNDPTVRNYVYVCLGALVVILFALLHQGLGTGSLMPVLVGIMGVVTRWRVTPLLLIVALTALYYIEMVRYLGIYRTPGYEGPELADLVLAGAVLIYTAGFYRFLGLYQEIIPRDAAKPAPDLPARRSLDVVPHNELAWLPLVTVWAVVALGVWLLLPLLLRQLVGVAGWWLPAAEVPYLLGQVDLRPQDWQALLLVWTVGVGLLVLSGLLHYLGARRMTVAEAELLLQDVIWRETRREQRRISRWLAWARARRREGTS